VKLATHKMTRKVVAVKLVNLICHSSEYHAEVDALRALNHPNVVACFHSEKSERNTGTIFLEYLPHPTLFKFLQSHGPCAEDLSFGIFTQVVDAVCHLHERNVSHNDLKPENLSFNQAKVFIKLFDFGLSETVDPSDPSSTNFFGSPLYMAPEVLQRLRHNPFLSDVWSLGIILYELLTGDSPFSCCGNMDDLLDRISGGNAIAIPDSISEDIRLLLSKMLNFEPIKRPRAEEIKRVVLELLGKSRKRSLPGQLLEQPPRREQQEHQEVHPQELPQKTAHLPPQELPLEQRPHLLPELPPHLLQEHSPTPESQLPKQPQAPQTSASNKEKPSPVSGGRSAAEISLSFSESSSSEDDDEYGSGEVPFRNPKTSSSA